MDQKRIVTMREIREKVESFDIVSTERGNCYIQCIRREITGAERKYLVDELNCLEQRFNARKNRFYLPADTQLVNEVE